MLGYKPKPLFLPGLIRSVSPASADPPSKKAAAHCQPLGLPSTISVMQGCSEPGQAGTGGRSARLCALPRAVPFLVTQAWRGQCPGPEAHHLSQKQLHRSLAPSPPLLTPHVPLFLPAPPLAGHFCTKRFHSPLPVLRDETTCVSIPTKRTRATQAPRPAKCRLCLPVYTPQGHPATSTSDPSLFMNRGRKLVSELHLAVSKDPK